MHKTHVKLLIKLDYTLYCTLKYKSQTGQIQFSAIAAQVYIEQPFATDFPLVTLGVYCLVRTAIVDLGPQALKQKIDVPTVFDSTFCAHRCNSLCHTY